MKNRLCLPLTEYMEHLPHPWDGIADYPATRERRWIYFFVPIFSR
ncbi:MULTISPECIES: hypothetical protein [Paraburkholderia]|nr:MULTISPECIES: hypothetical protein [Paraburkholderia]MCX4152710.1 hypothetical protein [Paraburkholderia aspalathi]